MRPIGIDLFSGVGGFSLGFEQAGFDVMAAVEIDPIHAAAHKFNFPECVIIPKSISAVTGAEIRSKSTIGAHQVDVVFGGAPCQGFSLIGQRSLDDPRNLLVREFVRVVGELDAKYFVFENVKGLTLGKHRAFLDEFVASFQRLGYDVVLPWQVLNAANFGVPQNRERLFLMGCKHGLKLPEYPQRMILGKEAPDANRRPDVNCLDAIGDLPEVELFPELLASDSVQTKGWGTSSLYASMMRCISNDAWGFGHIRVFDKDLLTSSARTCHTDISRQRFSNAVEGSIEPISRFFKLPRSGISNTLRAGTDSSRGAFTSPRPIHFAQPRCITVREMARLHSFPDWFRFHKTKWHGARQIGNAVPPFLAKAVAEEIMKAMIMTPKKSTQILPLGDESLLEMDMSEASKFWGIKNPIGKRNKKSGNKKRKQKEIEYELDMARVNE